MLRCVVGGMAKILFVFKGDQRDEEEETQMKKSESEVEVSTGVEGGTNTCPGVAPHCSGTQLCLTLAWHPQEAAAIIAQRPDNPREFFKQQERVASASSGSCDAPSPFNHRPGSLRAPCPLPTAPLLPTRPHFSGLG